MTHKAEGFESIPPHWTIVRHWRPFPEFRHVFENEPCCFACRNGVHGWQELQRAHIIADCHGGSFEPSNFVLLCLPCHREAPMVADRTMFLRWVQTHASFSQPFADAAQAICDLQHYGLTVYPEDGPRFAEFLRSRQIRFHPHSATNEKMRALLFMVGEYLKARCV